MFPCLRDGHQHYCSNRSGRRRARASSVRPPPDSLPPSPVQTITAPMSWTFKQCPPGTAARDPGLALAGSTLGWNACEWGGPVEGQSGVSGVSLTSSAVMRPEMVLCMSVHTETGLVYYLAMWGMDLSIAYVNQWLRYVRGDLRGFSRF